MRILIVLLLVGCTTTPPVAWTNINEPTRDFDQDSYECSISTDHDACLEYMGWQPLK